MTNKHPLTIQTCRQIIGIEDFRGSAEMSYMRAAADWQLEQVMKWLDEHLTNYLDPDYLGSCESIPDLEDHLKKAMRPTTQENN